MSLIPVLNAQMPVHKLLLIDQAPVIQKLLRLPQTLEFPKTAFTFLRTTTWKSRPSMFQRSKPCTKLPSDQVPLEQVMTIGDNSNDLPTLRGWTSSRYGHAPKQSNRSKSRHRNQQWARSCRSCSKVCFGITQKSAQGRFLLMIIISQARTAVSHK